jgi:CDP-diacylglycerol---glycerol-3-phosphate 3-phosphatidyltransferase
MSSPPPVAAPALARSVDPVHRRLPNQITILRLFLAGVFFVVLNLYRYPHTARPALLAAIVLFILAALTDWLDGYLARKWHVESTFGRIMDPFCDKVLILGTFIYLAGPRFVNPVFPADERFLGIVPGNMVTGIYPWMVVLILARELLVTGVRDELESMGVKFGANLFGKLKMVLQSISIPVILGIVWLNPYSRGNEWMAWVRNALIYATLLATLFSGIPYIISAVRALRPTK